jgi:hypothetical protein
MITRTYPRSTFDVVERRRYDAAVQTARNEAKQRFSPLTLGNAQERVEWESARIRELMS